MIIRTEKAILADGKVNNVKYQLAGEKRTPMLTFSIGYGQDPENSKHKLWLNCKCFYDNAKNWQYLQKGMNVLVAGERKIEPYNGNDRETCLVTFVGNSLQFQITDVDETDDVYEQQPSTNNSGELKELSQDELDVLPF